MIGFLEEPWLTFLSLRHQEEMVRFDTYAVRCECQEDVEVFSQLSRLSSGQLKRKN